MGKPNRISAYISVIVSKRELDSVSVVKDYLTTAGEGIFFEGQVFDPYAFVARIIKQAKRSIILLDNYIDETVLTLLAKRKKDVSATIYSKSISKQMQQDLAKHNRQFCLQ